MLPAATWYSSGGLQLTRSMRGDDDDAVPEDRPEDRQVASAGLSEAHPLERRLARTLLVLRDREQPVGPGRHEPEIEVRRRSGPLVPLQEAADLPAVRPHERIADVAVRSPLVNRSAGDRAVGAGPVVHRLVARGVDPEDPAGPCVGYGCSDGPTAVVAIRALPAHRLVDDGHALALRVPDCREEVDLAADADEVQLRVGCHLVDDLRDCGAVVVGRRQLTTAVVLGHDVRRADRRRPDDPRGP